MIRITYIRQKITENENTLLLKKKIMSILRISNNELIQYEIVKKSIDARRKHDMIYFIYTVDVKVINEKLILKKHHSNKDIFKTPNIESINIQGGCKRINYPPVIIGTGPSGLFAGLLLSKYGYNPILLERGEDVDRRTEKINKFWHSGDFDSESNVQFGEGGAGTFSDGKLTTLINDRRINMVLSELVKAGAPEEILYTNKPHIGTDILKTVVKNLREQIIQNGGEIKFSSKATDIEIENNIVKTVIVNDSMRNNCDIVLLGIGHSARDTFEMLYRRGVTISQKPFSIGVRIEHPQEIINIAQYGKFAEHPNLGAADYKLSYHSKSNRTAYTFCMCPGGYVVAAASEYGGIVVNGMSEYKRDGRNANSALLVNISTKDFDSSHPLAGIEFQRKWEKLAYSMAGENYNAPVQLVGDFMTDQCSTKLGSIIPTYKPGITFVQLKNCLPNYIIDTMKEAIQYFDSKIHGFSMPDSIMTGVETRSSSPIRINRDEHYLSNIYGLYPMGEGAGYAGGIMSSAIDGIRVAEEIMSKFCI